jgi:hypothetical protein
MPNHRCTKHFLEATLRASTFQQVSIWAHAPSAFPWVCMKRSKTNNHQNGRAHSLIASTSILRMHALPPTKASQSPIIKTLSGEACWR